MDGLTQRARVAIEGLARSPAAQALDALIAAASRGDGDAAAQALERLPEQARLVATFALGLAHPAVAAALATRADATLPGRRALDWSSFCDADLASAWGIGLAGVVPDETGAAILGRTDYGARALLAVARDRVARGAFEGARCFAGAMPALAKLERAVTLTLIALASDPTQLPSALAAADVGPVIQSGGEEVEALAAVLAELTVLPPEHEVVGACVLRLVGWREHQMDQRDQKSFGYALATKACARAASPERPGWLAHAERLARLVWRGGEDVASSLDAARARVAGQDAPPPIEPVPAPRPAPDLAQIAAQPRPETRWKDVTYWMRNPEHEPVVGLRAAIAPPALVTDDARRTLLAALAAAHAAAGDAEAAESSLGVLVSMGRALSSRAWDAARTLEGERAGRWTRTALDAGLGHTMFDGRWDTPAAAPVLARLALSAGETALLLDVVRAAAVVREHEDHPTAEAASLRKRRIREMLDVIAGTLEPTTLEALLPELRTVLGTGSPLLASLASAFPEWPRERVESELGPIDAGSAAGIASAWARVGLTKEALALVAELQPRDRARALLTVARVPLAAADAKLVRAAFEKCPKVSRERLEQGLWKHQRALLRLHLGDVDETLEVLASQADVRYSDTGPGALALEIARHLDATSGWSSERARRLVTALGSSGIIQQDLPRAIFALVPKVAPHTTLDDALLAPLAKKLTEGERAVLDLSMAVAAARGGDHGTARERVARALGTKGRRYFVGPAYFLRATTGIGAGDPLWRAVIATAGAMQPNDAIAALVSGVAGIAQPDADGVDHALDVLASAEVVERVRTELAAELARAGDASAEALLTRAIERAPDASTARLRAGWAAVWMARRGAPSARVAELSSLALEP